MPEDKRIADYSAASDQERKCIIQLLRKNFETTSSQANKHLTESHQEQLEKIISIIEQGGSVKGPDFDFLISIIRKKL